MFNKILFIHLILISVIHNNALANFDYGSWKYTYHVPNFVLNTNSYNGDKLILSNSYKNSVNNIENSFKIKIGTNNSGLTKSDIGKAISCYMILGNKKISGYIRIVLPNTFELYINNFINSIYKSNIKNIKIVLPEIHKELNFSLDGFDNAYYSALSDHNNGFHYNSLNTSDDATILITITIIIIIIVYIIVANINKQKQNTKTNVQNEESIKNKNIAYYHTYNQSIQEYNNNPNIISDKYKHKNDTILGNVYILSNQAMPGIYKIGCTSRNTKERVKELNSVTSIPTCFNIEYTLTSRSYKIIEKETHKNLATYNYGKEFFKLELFKCIMQVKKIAYKYDAYYKEYYRDQYIKNYIQRNIK